MAEHIEYVLVGVGPKPLEQSLPRMLSDSPTELFDNPQYNKIDWQSRNEYFHYLAEAAKDGLSTVWCWSTGSFMISWKDIGFGRSPLGAALAGHILRHERLASI
jgi:hypothetical protein